MESINPPVEPVQPESVHLLKRHVPHVHGYVAVFLAGALSATAIFASAASIPDFANNPMPSKPHAEVHGSKGGKVGRADDRIIVKFKAKLGATETGDILESHGLSVKSEMKQIGVKVINVPNGKTPEEVVEDLNLSEKDAIEYAEVDALFTPASVTPNDPSYPSEWHIPKIGANVAWDTTKGSGVTIAILDGGVDCTQPDLAASCVSGWNVVSNNNDAGAITQHGTAVAATAASIGDNSLGGTGVAYQAKIMPVRLTNDPGGSSSCSAIGNGILWAADHGAKVLSNSYFVWGCSNVNDAATYAAGKGALYVRAVGNNGDGTLGSGIDTTSKTPEGNLPNNIIVSGTDSNDVKTAFSNWGNTVDLAAPATPIYCLWAGAYTTCWGTSFSVPIVAGTLALEFAANPTLTAAQARNILFSTAVDLGTPGWDSMYGWGRVNTAAAVAMAASTTGGQDTLAPSTPGNLTGTSPDSGHVTLSWSAAADNVGVTGYSIWRNGSKLNTTTGTSYSDTAVSAQTTYNYTVQATDAAGNLSAMSNIASVTTPALTLSILSTSVPTKTGTTATVSWTTNVPATAVVKYGTSKTNLSLSKANATSGTSGSVGLTGLTKKTTYYYQVTVTGTDGSTSSSAVGSFATKPR